MKWIRRRAQPVPEQRPAPIATAMLDEAATRGWEARERLFTALADLDDAGDADAARATLDALAVRLQLIIRLDMHARERWWTASASEVPTQWAALLNDDRPAGPIAVAMASMDRDGRVRQRAIERIVAAPDPALMPFLVLRTSDWVRQVRDRARAGLALLLADHPETLLPSALPMVPLIESRMRGGFAMAQAHAAVVGAAVPVRQRLASSPDRRVRRLVVDIGLAQRWWTLAELAAIARSDPDVRNRVRAAEAACRDAVWTRRVAVLHGLTTSRYPDVRALALTGLARLGHDRDVAAHLDDSASLVRAVARDAARRLGIDARERYRAAVAAPTPTLGAIAGLAETGADADAALLRPLLRHPTARVRAEAVRALRRLDAVDVTEMVGVLRDPSPAVVREATTALGPFDRSLPAELPWQLLADPRPELRRAGYRLLHRYSTQDRLRAALLLATDADTKLAGRGRSDATGMARDAERPRYPRKPDLGLELTADQRMQLAGLIDRASVVLGERTSADLRAWLARTTPRD